MIIRRIVVPGTLALPPAELWPDYDRDARTIVFVGGTSHG